ncbi:MAG: hypothetical protein PHQ43_04965 [Dehalococcoidales bacterium]|nr:hypothetical protein [Dehalococcoidales bacterium]
MSPIKGISEIVRLPCLGKIRLGTREERDDGTFLIPADHFICPDEVKQVFGEKPKELRIMFPTENSEQWASQYFRRYSPLGRLICRGDGETALVRADLGMEQTPGKGRLPEEMKEIACNPRTCPHYQCGDCRRVMNLQFLLPDCPGFGVYQLNTSSYHSMRNVNSMVNFTRSICGRVSMIPLSLHLVEQVVDPEGWPATAYVLNVTSPNSLSRMQRLAQGPPAEALLLPPPDSEAPDDIFPLPPARKTESVQTPAVSNENLLDLWARTKNKIWHFEIQDSQIANWFDKNYHIEVGLMDFEPPRPPSKLTAEILSAFCQSIDRYAGR